MPSFRFVSKETVYYETILKAENEEQYTYLAIFCYT